MGQISLQIPQSGLPNSTEDPKVASDFTTLQTLVNGQIDSTNLSPTAGITDAQLASSPLAVRRLLLQATSSVPGNQTYIVGGQDFMLREGTTIYTQGSGGGFNGAEQVPLWLGDSGLSGNPLDFSVAGKTAYCRIRAGVVCNTAPPGANFTVGLYLLQSAAGGTGNTLTCTYALVAGSQVSLGAPAASSLGQAEGPQFALPTTSGGYALGVKLSAGAGATNPNSFLSITAQLYAYHA